MSTSAVEQRYSNDLDRARRSESASLVDSGKKTISIAKDIETGHEVKAALDTAKFAWKLRKDAESGKKTPWLIALAAGIAADIGGVTWIVGAVITILLLILLWGHGRWKIKVLQFFDLIPFISILPLTTISVLWCWHDANKKRKKKIKKAEEIEKSVGIGEQKK